MKKLAFPLAPMHLIENTTQAIALCRFMSINPLFCCAFAILTGYFGCVCIFISFYK